jgi:hypothetical protein
MWRFGVGVFSLLLIGATPSFGCWCGGGSASDYTEAASIVFVGKALFSDDDGSRKFTQKTLVRFELKRLTKALERAFTRYGSTPEVSHPAIKHSMLATAI